MPVAVDAQKLPGPFAGTCAQYHDAMLPEGKAGITEARRSVSIVWGKYTPQLAAQPTQSWSCGCNKQTYRAEDDCIANCKVSMGCFTNICMPNSALIKPTKHCGTTHADLTFSVTNKTTLSSWIMPSADSASPSCVSAYQTYMSLVAVHEQNHASINDQVVAAWNKANAEGMSATSCADSDEEASNQNEIKSMHRQMHLERKSSNSCKMLLIISTRRQLGNMTTSIVMIAHNNWWAR
jgi:hypothetical protein